MSDLVAEVKAAQRASPAFKEAWIQWCNLNAGRKRDPTKLEPAALAAGWEACAHTLAAATPAPVLNPGAAARNPAESNPLDSYADAAPASPWAAEAAPAEAAPAPAAAAPMLVPKHELVPAAPVAAGDCPTPDQVKDTQRASSDFKHMWGVWCDQHARGFRDPAKMEPAQLQAAWQYATLHSGVGVGGAPLDNAAQAEAAAPIQQRDLVPAAAVAAGDYPTPDQVKDTQRASSDFKYMWGVWCDQHAGGFRDPAKMEPAQLRAAWQYATLHSGVGVGGAPLDDAAQAEAAAALVQAVKERQRGDPAFKELWGQWCQNNVPGGFRDPARLPAAQVRQALVACDTGARGGAAHRTPAAPMVPRPSLPYHPAAAGGRAAGGSREVMVAPRPAPAARYSPYPPAAAAPPFLPPHAGAAAGAVAVHPAAGRPPPAGMVAQLAGVVKESQRNSAEFKEAWGRFCEEHARGFRDPARLSEDVLRRGLAEIGENPLWLTVDPAFAGGDVPQLATFVKQAQRQVSGFRDAWGDWCEQNVDGGFRDPAKLPIDTLRKGVVAALEACGADPAVLPRAQMAQAPAPAPAAAPFPLIPQQSGYAPYGHPPLPPPVPLPQRPPPVRTLTAPPPPSPRDASAPTTQQFRLQQLHRPAAAAAGNEVAARQSASFPTLVEMVKENQRQNPQFKEAWIAWCDANARGFRDPKRLEEATLRAGIAAVTQSQDWLTCVASSTVDRAQLVDLLKGRQRADEAFKARWGEWCEANAGGFRDPAKMDEDVLAGGARDCGLIF